MKKTTSLHRLALAATAALSLAGTAAYAQEATPADMPWVSHRAVENMEGVVTWQQRCYADVAPRGVGEATQAGAERVRPSCARPYAEQPSATPPREAAASMGVASDDARCRTTLAQAGGGEVDAAGLERDMPACDRPDEQTSSATDAREPEALTWARIEADVRAGRTPQADVYLVETDTGPALLLVRQDLADPYRLVMADHLPVATVYD